MVFWFVEFVISEPPAQHFNMRFPEKFFGDRLVQCERSVIRVNAKTPQINKIKFVRKRFISSLNEVHETARFSRAAFPEQKDGLFALDESCGVDGKQVGR